MKLSDAQQWNVEQQLGVEALSDNHGVMPSLKEALGDHTFFLDKQGLHVIEADPSSEQLSGNVVKVASWASDEQTELLIHEPEVQLTTVHLGKGLH